MKRVTTIVAAILTIAAAPVDRPPLRPQHDVDVTYRTLAPGGAPALQQRMRWDVADQRLRVDLPTPGVYMLVDYRSHAMSLVREPARAALLLGAGGPLPGETPDGNFQRQGADRVADQPCIEWSTNDRSGHPVLVCITTDGIMLRARVGETILVEAAWVAYGHQDSRLFAIPVGFTQN